MQNSSASSAQKCAEMFRDNGHYWFVCYHCGSTFEQLDETKSHVDSHFNNAAAANDDSVKVELEPELFLNATDWPMDVKDFVSTLDEMVSNGIGSNDVCDVEPEPTANADDTNTNIDKPFKCEYCDFPFRHKRSMIYHIRQQHDTKNINKLTIEIDVGKTYNCEHCDLSFRHRRSLIFHMRDKHEPNAIELNISSVGNKYMCAVCNSTFSANKSLKHHIASAHGRVDLLTKSFECETCGKLFAQRSRLECHLKCHIKKQWTMPSGAAAPPLKCGLCDSTLKNRSRLRYHMKREHPKPVADLEQAKPFKCHQCDKCFVHKSRLDAHLNVHENPKPLNCDLCAQVFTSRGKLQYHMQMHKEQIFACPHCEFKSRTKNNLDQHVRNVHTKDLTRFACDQCNKLFKYKVSYDYHKRQHSGERPYQCYICGMAYYTSSKLSAHMKNTHSTETFSCDLCSKSLKSLFWLKKHLKTHSDERLYNCTVCGSSFKSANTLRQHKMIHDKVKRFKCNYCDMRFAQSAGRRGHERMRHLLI